jgi:hypothetical protein
MVRRMLPIPSGAAAGAVLTDLAVLVWLLRILPSERMAVALVVGSRHVLWELMLMDRLGHRLVCCWSWMMLEGQRYDGRWNCCPLEEKHCSCRHCHCEDGRRDVEIV